MSKAGELSEAALELLQSISDTADGVRYQSCHGREQQSAAHELENAGYAIWKGNSFGSNFYCITPAGRAALPTPDTGRGRAG